MDEKKLIQKAMQARENAYAPYSGFRVGACVHGESGREYTGCNIENTVFSATCCAERVAIYSALAAGEKRFTHVAIVSDSAEPTFPCGTCRQVIMEFAPGARVLCANREGAFVSYPIKELLPHAFAYKEGTKENIHER